MRESGSTIFPERTVEDGSARLHPAGRDESRLLRIAFVLEGLALGGCPINAIDLARTLRARNHVVHLLAVDEAVRVSVLPYARQAGFDVFILPAHAGVFARARQIRRYVDQHDLNVIHAFAPWLARAAVLAAGVNRRRICVVQNWTMDNVYPISRRTPLVLGTVSLRDEALAHRGGGVCLLEPPVDLVRDAPDPSARRRFRQDHGIGPDEVAICLVGRVDRSMKLSGILLAIEAMERRADPQTRLVIVGDGDAMAEVKARVSSANNALGRDAIILAGHLPDPHDAYAAADIALAMGGSAIRVLAHGCPLIGLGLNGFSLVFAPDTEDHFFTAGFFGTEVSGEPLDNLLAQLDRLNDPRVRRRLGKRGRVVAHERYGLEAVATQLEAIYVDTFRAAAPPLVSAHDMAMLAARTSVGTTRRAVLKRLRRSA